MMGIGAAQQTGAAGEHYVAFRLAQMGFVVGLPRSGSPAIDLLASDPLGHRVVAVQVKSSEWALREMGRGANRKLHHVDFALGAKTAKLNDPKVFVVFVDLRGHEPDSTPIAWVVPSVDLCRYCKSWVDDVAWVRWQPLLTEIEKYRNNWSLLTNELAAVEPAT